MCIYVCLCVCNLVCSAPWSQWRDSNKPLKWGWGLCSWAQETLTAPKGLWGSDREGDWQARGWAGSSGRAGGVRKCRNRHRGINGRERGRKVSHTLGFGGGDKKTIFAVTVTSELLGHLSSLLFSSMENTGRASKSYSLFKMKSSNSCFRKDRCPL